MIYVTTILIIAILATYLLLKILIEMDYKSLFLPLLAGWCALRFLLKIIKPYLGDHLPHILKTEIDVCAMIICFAIGMRWSSVKSPHMTALTKTMIVAIASYTALALYMPSWPPWSQLLTFSIWGLAFACRLANLTAIELIAGNGISALFCFIDSCLLMLGAFFTPIIWHWSQ